MSAAGCDVYAGLAIRAAIGAVPGPKGQGGRVRAWRYALEVQSGGAVRVQQQGIGVADRANGLPCRAVVGGVPPRSGCHVYARDGDASEGAGVRVGEVGPRADQCADGCAHRTFSDGRAIALNDTHGESWAAQFGSVIHISERDDGGRCGGAEAFCVSECEGVGRCGFGTVVDELDLAVDDFLLGETGGGDRGVQHAREEAAGERGDAEEQAARWVLHVRPGQHGRCELYCLAFADGQQIGRDHGRIVDCIDGDAGGVGGGAERAVAAVDAGVGKVANVAAAAVPGAEVETRPATCRRIEVRIGRKGDTGLTVGGQKERVAV